MATVFTVGQQIRIGTDSGENGLERGAKGFITYMYPEQEVSFDNRDERWLDHWAQIANQEEFGFVEHPNAAKGFWMHLFDIDNYVERQFFVVTEINGRSSDVREENSEFFRDGDIMWSPVFEHLPTMVAYNNTEHYAWSIGKPLWGGFRYSHAPNRFFQSYTLLTPGSEIDNESVVGYWLNDPSAPSRSLFGYIVSDGTNLRYITKQESVGEENEYRVCPRCGNEYITTAGDDEYLCQDCRGREYVTPYHHYALPVRCYSLTGRENDIRYLGTEIEVELGGERDANAGWVVRNMPAKDGKPFVYVSHDGSLNSGFEIITQPATLGYHKALEEEYTNVFRWLVSKGYRGHESLNAGIHVHVNRAYFGNDEEQEEAIANLLYLIEKYWDEIIIFSRRDYEKSKSYTQKIDDCYDYDDYIRHFNKTGEHSGHYYALNITNANTIEFRMFRSTLNVNTYMCILELVDSLCKFVKTKTYEEINKVEFETLLPPRALEYYRARINARRFNEV